MKIDNKQYLQPVEDIIQYNMYASKSVPSILDDWANNKYDLYKRFGNKTIVQSELLSLEIDDDNEIGRSFVSFKNKVCDYIFNNRFMSNALFDFVSYGVGRDGFKNNRVEYDWDSSDAERRIITGNYSLIQKPKISISKGTKFSKACRAFFDMTDPEEEERLKTLQNFYSTYRQNLSAKKQGRLFLSIDPYDYLTISDNNHNWSSCHNMVDGEYRVGNLNYMADEVTIVAYYASDDLFNEELEAFGNIKTWNSKRWRVLIHLQIKDDKIVAVYNRQYPFTSDKLLIELDKMLMSLCPEIENSILQEYEGTTEMLKNTYSILERGNDTCHYNDFRNNNGCFVRLSESYLNGEEEVETLVVGHSIYCLKCGKHLTDRAERGFCDYCSDEYYCDECESYHVYEDVRYIEAEDRYICHDCYEREHEVCEECREEFHTDQTRYVEVLNKTFCDSCFNDLVEKDSIMIYSINDMARQSFSKPEMTQELLSMYKELVNEKEQLIEHYSKETDMVITSSVLISIGFNEVNASEYRNLQGQCSDYNTHSVFRTNSYHKSPFLALSDYEGEMPKVKKIILIGSTNEETFKDYIGNTYSCLEDMGLDKEVLDYSRVRVV